MAKNAGRLAGLAALAGAAYMMSKGKDKEKGTTDSNPTRPARPEPTETRLKSPAESIAAADKSDKSTSISTKGAAGTTTPGTDKSAVDLSEDRNKPVKPASEPKPVVTDTPSTPPQRVDRVMEDPTKQKVLDTLNQRAGANTPSALRSDQLADVSRAVNREAKTSKAAQADFPDITRTASSDKPAAIKAKKLYDTLSTKSGANTSSAQKTDALMVASRAAKAADAKRRAAKQSSFKSGGMVSKVSSASSRADGIASRGKTRCKMY